MAKAKRVIQDESVTSIKKLGLDFPLMINDSSIGRRISKEVPKTQSLKTSVATTLRFVDLEFYMFFNNSLKSDIRR